MSGRVITRGLLLISIIFISTGNLCALEKPFSPIIYSDGTGGLELYWFYPGRHQVHAGNDLAPPLQGGIPGIEDKNWSLFTGFDIMPPVYIQTISTYLMNEDISPVWTGDQFSPMNMFLADGFLVDYISILWLDTIALDSSISEPSQKIERSLNYPINNSFYIWAGLEWLPGTPTAPVVGRRLGTPYLEQYLFTRHDTHDSLERIDFNLMTGLTYLGWQGSDAGGLSFRVRFSEMEETLTENSVIVGETVGDSLLVVFPEPRSGFAMIEACDGQAISFSDKFPINLERIAPLEIALVEMNSNFPEGHFGECRVEITNVGDYPVEFTWHGDALLLPIPTHASVVSPGATKGADFIYLVPEDSLSACLILDLGDDFYPCRYDILLIPRNPTDVEGDDEILPAGFRVGEPYPNPFNSTVSIQVDSDKKGELIFQVFNLLGQEVFNTSLNPGNSKIITWAGTDNRGAPVGSGIYFFVFSQDNSRIVRKAILLK